MATERDSTAGRTISPTRFHRKRTLSQKNLSTYVGVALLITSPCSLADSTRMSAGSYLSTGDYGHSSNTDIQTLWVSVRHKIGRWTLKASSGYLRIAGLTTVLPNGETGGVTAVRRNRRGIADLTLSAANLVYYDSNSQTGLSLRGKVKVPTADENEKLGTGKFDYTLELAPFRKVGVNTLFATLGYKVYGDTATTDYNNVWLAKAGLMSNITDKQALGLMGSFRQKSTLSSHPRRELMAFHTYRISKQTKLQTFLMTGFTDASPDVAGGISLMHNL